MTLTVRDVIKRAGRMHGCWASGQEPDAEEAADALMSFNAMKRALFGTVIGPRLSPRAPAGSPVQAETGGEYLIPAGAFTLTAPANPRPGARFGVVDAALGFAAQPCTVLAPGLRIDGVAAPFVLSGAGQCTRFWFRSDAGNWVVEADSAGFDEPLEFPDALVAYLPNMLAVVIAAEYGADLRPDVVAIAQEGRAAFARTYGRRGREMREAPLGLALAVVAGG